MAFGQWRSDGASDIKSSSGLNPALRASTATGSSTDLLGLRSATAVVQIGVITDGTHTLKLQDSPDNSAWTDVAAGNTSAAFTPLTSGSTAGTVQEVSYLGNQRYLRVVTTVTGSPATGGYYGGTIVAAQPVLAPV